MSMGAVMEGGLAEKIDEMLHGLCQPLTVLQCRLALGELNGQPNEMRAAIGEALTQCMRLNHAVAQMREMLLEAANTDR